MRVNKRTVVFLIIAMFFTGLFFRYLNRAPKRHYADFRVYHATAQRFAAKEDIYSRPDEKITPFKYSPMFAFLVSPLSLFSRKVASCIFFTLNFLSLIAIVVFSRRIIIQVPVSFKETILITVLPLLFTLRFILQVWDSGQVNILMFLLVVIGLYSLQKNKTLRGGGFIGLSVMFKYMPFVFVPYFLMRKKFKLVLAVLSFILLYCFMPVLYLGIETGISYLKNWLPFISNTSLDTGSWYDYKNQSLFSMVLRFFTVDSPYLVSKGLFTFRQGLAIAFSLGFCLYLLILIPAKRPVAKCLDYSLLFLCMALFNPNAWMMNFVVFLFAYMTVSYYLVRVQFKDRLTLILVILSFIMASFGSESLVGNNLENLFEELSFVTFGALILASVLLRLKFKSKLVS